MRIWRSPRTMRIWRSPRTMRVWRSPRTMRVWRSPRTMRVWKSPVQGVSYLRDNFCGVQKSGCRSSDPPPGYAPALATLASILRYIV